MKITTVTVGDEEVEIEVDMNGRFHAEYDGQSVGGDTLQEVKDHLVKMNRKVLDERAVPVTIIGIVPVEKQKDRHGFRTSDPFEDGVGVLNAKLRGRHARTREFLYIAEGENAEERKKFSLHYSGSKRYQVACRRLSLAESLEYIRLAKAAEFAQQQLDVWIDARRLDPAKAVGEVT
jgi:hypothetical protein